MPPSTHIISEDQKNTFFAQSDIIIPSPGVDINPYRPQIGHKIMTELDLFYHYFRKPIIAITGSVGKTTVTSLLGQLLQLYDLNVGVGGNIGTPCLDLIKQQNQLDYALLEVSSFQLEHCKQFAPDIAIITNIVPNHLDRHHTMKQYRNAKFMIYAYQTEKQIGFMPHELLPFLPKTVRSSIKPFSKIIPTLPPITFVQNWHIICTVLKHLGCNLTQLTHFAQQLHTVEHRLEYVTTINNIDLYNDSKSTTPASTLAAVEQFKDKKIHLILGGLSKGLNRENLIRQLYTHVASITCFGQEAKTLFDWCCTYNIPASKHSSLEQALAACLDRAQEYNIILFSPAGSSFDLFDNFEHRGKIFKTLTYEIKTYYAANKKERICIKQKNK